MKRERYDIQGRFLGMPYDFRVPTVAKALRRMYASGGPMFVPRVFGLGWTLNFANPYARLITAALLGLALAVVIFA